MHDSPHTPAITCAILGWSHIMQRILHTLVLPCVGSGTVANVLSQLVLPFNMVGSLLFLGTRYRKVHYIGSILAIYGVVRRVGFAWVAAALCSAPSSRGNHVASAPRVFRSPAGSPHSAIQRRSER